MLWMKCVLIWVGTYTVFLHNVKHDIDSFVKYSESSSKLSPPPTPTLISPHPVLSKLPHPIASKAPTQSLVKPPKRHPKVSNKSPTL